MNASAPVTSTCPRKHVKAMSAVTSTAPMEHEYALLCELEVVLGDKHEYALLCELLVDLGDREWQFQNQIQKAARSTKCNAYQEKE